jgi:hypothetical protein
MRLPQPGAWNIFSCLKAMAAEPRAPFGIVFFVQQMMCKNVVGAQCWSGSRQISRARYRQSGRGSQFHDAQARPLGDHIPLA